jgi:hypothetical protein
VTLSADKPGCKAASDAFVGDPITSFTNSSTYGDRSLHHEDDDDTAYCPNLCPCPPPPTCVPKPAYTPRPGCSDTPPKWMLSASTTTKPGTSETTFTNRDPRCSYVVGAATYKKFDSSPYDDEKYDCKQAIIGPNTSMTLSVSKPPCNYESDAFSGDAMDASLGGIAYGSRGYDHEEDNSGHLCERQCVPPKPVPTPHQCDGNTHNW